LLHPFLGGRVEVAEAVTGNLWRDTSILRILNESSAKGVYVFNTMRLTGTWRTELKPENEWGRAECPPIVSEELWNQVNQIIEEQLKSWKKPGKPPVHLFSGLAHCSCGHKMYVAANSPKYFCRKCRNKIPIADLENIARHELKAFFGQPKRIAGHLKEADRNLAEKSALLDTHKREIQKVKEEMHQTHQLYLHKQISVSGAVSPPTPRCRPADFWMFYPQALADGHRFASPENGRCKCSSFPVPGAQSSPIPSAAIPRQTPLRASGSYPCPPPADPAPESTNRCAMRSSKTWNRRLLRPRRCSGLSG
jgi:hypothetical protein